MAEIELDFTAHECLVSFRGPKVDLVLPNKRRPSSNSGGIARGMHRLFETTASIGISRAVTVPMSLSGAQVEGMLEGLLPWLGQEHVKAGHELAIMGENKGALVLLVGDEIETVVHAPDALLGMIGVVDVVPVSIRLSRSSAEKLAAVMVAVLGAQEVLWQGRMILRMAALRN